jgi:hypothetical protein
LNAVSLNWLTWGKELKFKLLFCNEGSG